MPAPYSDNLYSVDSDDDVDAFSPTDGYFRASARHDSEPTPPSVISPSSPSPSRSNVPHVPNIFVEDPTIVSRDSKVREARRQSEQHSHLVNSGSAWADEEGTSSSGRRTSNDDLETGLAGHISSRSTSSQATSPQPIHPSTHHQEAPPAYTPPRSINYQTIVPSAMGRPEQHQQPSHTPEYMSNAFHQEPAKLSRWKRTKNSIARLNIRQKIKKTLGFLVVFSVIFMIFSSFTLRSSHNHPGYSNNGSVTQPDMDDGDFVWAPNSACFNTPHRFMEMKTEVDLLPVRNLSIVQTVDKDFNKRGRAPHVSGSIIVKPADRSSSPYIDLKVLTNDADISVSVDFDKETQKYTITTPSKVDWKSRNQGPCIQIRAILNIPLDSTLRALNIDAERLDVFVKEGLILGARNRVSISTISGNVETPEKKSGKQAPYVLSSREIYIHTTSGNVEGWYPLYDTLDVQTISGNIAAHIDPKPADPQAVAQAVLSVKSVSGTVNLNEPIDTVSGSSRPDRIFPPRDYTVDVVTASGDVSADLAITTRAVFHSQSGDLKLKLWPVLDAELLKLHQQDNKPFVETETKSGNTALTILEPLWTSLATVGGTIPPAMPKDENDPTYLLPPDVSDTFAVAGKPATAVLRSKHDSVSGSIKLWYPSSWEGNLYAKTISGSQTIHGKGLEVWKESKYFPRVTRGKKGSGDSELNIESVSGNQEVLVGK